MDCTGWPAPVALVRLRELPIPMPSVVEFCESPRKSSPADGAAPNGELPPAGKSAAWSGSLGTASTAAIEEGTFSVNRFSKEPPALPVFARFLFGLGDAGGLPCALLGGRLIDALEPNSSCMLEVDPVGLGADGAPSRDAPLGAVKLGGCTRMSGDGGGLPADTVAEVGVSSKSSDLLVSASAPPSDLSHSDKSSDFFCVVSPGRDD